MSIEDKNKEAEAEQVADGHVGSSGDHSMPISHETGSSDDHAIASTLPESSDFDVRRSSRGKENDAESNEDLNYMESEDDSDEDVYDSDDNAEIYMEIVKDEDRYG
ncbi:Hypothetical predicted protein [Olea europaea subsp. europaea]|uniref:Uncharacterized protein n=1 Tax=Olea europaea subsp. europaea TaxID=158383 RepID=A0A8S0TEF3_OLEEU|nr:Hypothetical predicted protein [Olea europaea subsp. europaea]